MVFSSLFLSALFHALFNFLICSAFLGKPSGCNIVNIFLFFFHKLPVFFVFDLKIIMDLEIAQVTQNCEAKCTSAQALKCDSLLLEPKAVGRNSGRLLKPSLSTFLFLGFHSGDECWGLVWASAQCFPVFSDLTFLN